MLNLDSFDLLQVSLILSPGTCEVLSSNVHHMINLASKFSFLIFLTIPWYIYIVIFHLGINLSLRERMFNTW